MRGVDKVYRWGACRVGEMSHPQNKFRILSVEILSQQRDILSYSWMSAHFLPDMSCSWKHAGYAFRSCRKNKMHSILYWL